MTCRVCRHTVLLASAAAKLDKTGAGKQLARAVRAVPIKLIYVAKSSSGPAQVSTCLPMSFLYWFRRLRTWGWPGDWAAKLARYVRVEQKRIQPNPKRSDAQAVAVRTEGDAVLKALAPSVRCPTHHTPHRPPPTVVGALPPVPRCHTQVWSEPAQPGESRALVERAKATRERQPWQCGTVAYHTARRCRTAWWSWTSGARSWAARASRSSSPACVTSHVLEIGV